MTLLRSERMGYYSIVMSRENAWEIMNEIGDLSAVEFVDLNQHEQVLLRPYSNYIKRCEEMELKIQSIEQTMIKFNKPIEICTEYKAFLKSQRDILKRRNKADYTYFDEIEHEIEQKMHTLNEQLKFYDAAVEKYNSIVENIHVLEEAKAYFSNDSEHSASFVSNDEESKINLEGSSRYVSEILKFQYLAGVIDRNDSQRFRKVLFRTTLGMVWSNLVDIEPQLGRNGVYSESKLAANSSNEQQRKTVFLIAYPGGEQNILHNKLHKIADSFGAHKFGIPTDKLGFSKRLDELRSESEDKWKIIQITREHINLLLDALSNPQYPNETWPMIEGFRLLVLKEKAIYHNLNMLKQQNKTLQGFFWCPLEMEEEVKKTIENLPKLKSHITKPELAYAERPANMQPPTYFRTNDFTAPFQEIVNTYGIPRYQEVNPGLFTIATFPFLFGVMFGDIGHGLILLVFGLYLCFNKNVLASEKGPLTSILSARYLLAMMGFFALYCGFIYNDFMALPLDIFGTCYEKSKDPSTYTKKDSTCVYTFGLDPSWYKATNVLTFSNSFKMKMAIILGVSHMILGTMLKVLNAIHFGSVLDFFFEWIPQIVFLCSTFGYMVVLIFLKWSTPYGIEGGVETSQAPAIINIFIDFVLNFGKFNVGTHSNTIKPLYGDQDGKTQSTVQRALLVVALICVPLMLLPKPLLLNLAHRKRHAKGEYVQQIDVKTEHMKIHEEELQEKIFSPLGKNESDFLRDDSEIFKDKISYRKSPETNRERTIKKDNDKSRELVNLEEIKQKKMHSIEIHNHEVHQEETFGDLFVHQLIETIEFVLGSVSHTASYLRLWALSLAHSQLAAVFFNYTIGGAIRDGKFLMTFVGYAIFAEATFGVLLCMDLMECFLHALRLHWVEFQSKFFKADGHLFAPFSFEAALKAEKK